MIIHHPHYDHHCPGLFNTNNGSAGYENTIINILTIIIISMWLFVILIMNMIMVILIMILAMMVMNNPPRHHCPGLFNTNDGSASYENTIINILTIIIIVTVLDP